MLETPRQRAGAAIAILGIAAYAWGQSAGREPSRQRTNILLVLIDDMGYGDLGCYGGTRVETPRIDALAKEGIRFTQFYVNAPICSPSRVALTTGQYPGRWRITSYLATREEDRQRGLADWLSPKAPSLARFLANAGYHTAHVGKWHMGGQRDVGDAPAIAEYGFAASLTNFEGLGERVLPLFEPLKNGKKLSHGPTEMSARFGVGPVRWVERHRVTEVYVDRALQEIRAAVAGGRPFYVNLWLDDVHSPNQAPPGMRGDGSPQAHYLGVIREMDRQLGRLFEYVRSEPSLRDSTLILLTSDNGPEAGLGLTGGLRGGKGNLYEGGIRSPLIAWHGKAAAAHGLTNQKTVLAAIDLVPSLLAMAGVRAPADVAFDGLDLSEALVGRSMPERDAPLMWVRPPDRPGPRGTWPDLAIRRGTWKLLVFRDGSKPELFDMSNDPCETINLARNHPERVQDLARQVIDWDRTIRTATR